jgi:protein arginine N-methyltransferase 5
MDGDIGMKRLTRSVITVVGAGRGPLVACALRAMKRANRRAMVYAVEKNASAFVT